MSERLPIAKTYKLFIGGAFPRSESGRSLPLVDGAGRVIAHTCRASRKDLRDAVVAARKAQPGWAGATAYLRGQILYRMAEMLEGKRAEFSALLAEGAAADPGSAIEPEREVTAAIDRLVAFAGWADKFQQVLGCQNAVAAPYWNITVPEPVGVVGVVCPREHALLALVSMLAPAVCAGNAVVVISPANAPVVSTFGEVCATSDLPGGVINLLTGSHEELIPFLATHRDVEAICAAGVSPEHARVLQLGAADNLKRVRVKETVDWLDSAACASPRWIEPVVEFKTVWHPVGA
ncbi:MAG: aldehyde dehydrogenase family protein [Phycisphaerales bacterium]